MRSEENLNDFIITTFKIEVFATNGFCLIISLLIQDSSEKQKNITNDI